MMLKKTSNNTQNTAGKASRWNDFEVIQRNRIDFQPN